MPVTDAAALSPECLIAAAVRADEPALRRFASSLLELGDMGAVFDTVSRIELAVPEDAADRFLGILEAEAQSVRSGGRDVRLFCVPVLAGRDAARSLPTERVLRALSLASAEGETFVVADGWVHPQDLYDAQAVGLRSLAAAFGGNALGRGEAVALPACSFPRFPAAQDDESWGIRIFSRSSSDAAVSAVVPRFVLGAVFSPAGSPASPDGLLAAVSGGSRQEMAARTRLRGAVSEALGPDAAVLEPCLPLWAPEAAAHGIAILASDERVRMAAAQRGQATDAHVYTSASGDIRVALTDSGGHTADRFDVPVSPEGSAQLLGLLGKSCRTVTVHHEPGSMPGGPRPH